MTIVPPRPTGIRAAAAPAALALALALAPGMPWLVMTPARAAQPGVDCAGQVAAFDATVKAPQRSLAVIAAAADPVLANPACPALERRRVGRLAALAHGEEAQRMAKAQAADGQRLAVLEKGASYGQPWQLMAAIGDLRQRVAGTGGKPDYGAASLAYQQALLDLDQLSGAGQAVPRDAVARIERLAGQTRMLAPTFTSGRGLLGRSSRNLVIETIPLPVQYEYNSDRMTELGRKYAEEMLEVLAERQKPRIELIGHTDPRGTDERNDELSLQRATALKQFMVSRGYPEAKVQVKGVGRRQPPSLIELERLTEEQVFQIQRRVELKVE